ncbi:hypothetical protein L9W97_01870 [Vibrio aestuarianus]|uniref:hypothetical protein n=1 Tax=Vibrio aestuarianus TaxID=28171 RepID=UPI00237D2278|nr:hypothetical protein [Vibrio aestuarianus]MDE1323867.1 hypothetical protein [Vibrio aestuarianus]
MDLNGYMSGAGDFFDKGMNYFLQYEAIQHASDFAGVTQGQVNNTPEVVAPEPNPAPVQPVANVAGVPLAYLALGGVVLLGAVLIAKS